jgi:outer membrane translocation and assembly module TamA
LLRDNVVTEGAVFGRRLAHGSLEYARPVAHTVAGGVALAGFVDTARAWQRLDSLAPSPLYIDAGVGLRVNVPGAPGAGGAIRLDIAHGLRGGGTTLSAGWGAAWPR